jgi:flavin reductase (DIM6/NTAB) family NADH-FMN oxidoreductase RutF
MTVKDGTDGSREKLDLRHALGAFATGVMVITTVSDDGEPHGMTATSFSALSLDPPLIQWNLRNSAWSCPIFIGAKHFTVNILREEQEDVSRLFASPLRDRFSRLDHTQGIHDLPLLQGSAAWFECAREDILPGGDHTINGRPGLAGAAVRRHPAAALERTLCRLVRCRASGAGGSPVLTGMDQ